MLAVHESTIFLPLPGVADRFVGALGGVVSAGGEAGVVALALAGELDVPGCVERDHLVGVRRGRREPGIREPVPVTVVTSAELR